MNASILHLEKSSDFALGCMNKTRLGSYWRSSQDSLLAHCKWARLPFVSSPLEFLSKNSFSLHFLPINLHIDAKMNAEKKSLKTFGSDSSIKAFWGSQWMNIVGHFWKIHNLSN